MSELKRVGILLEYESSEPSLKGIPDFLVTVIESLRWHEASDFMCLSVDPELTREVCFQPIMFIRRPLWMVATLGSWEAKPGISERRERYRGNG